MDEGSGTTVNDEAANDIDGTIYTSSHREGSIECHLNGGTRGGTRAGGVPADSKLTGQRLDGTDLDYYNARYYAPRLGGSSHLTP